MRHLFLLSILLAGMTAMGCVGPMACGTGCGVLGDSCGDCEGGFGPRQPMAYGPLDALRNARRSLVCGGGCGEVYYGEWTSSPPDCQDPCCGNEFVGGAVPCRPFCWQPGALLTNFYGRRFDDGGMLAGDCGCEGEVYENYEQDVMMESSAVSSHTCPSCTAQRQSVSREAIVSRPAVDPATSRMRSAQRVGSSQGGLYR